MVIGEVAVQAQPRVGEYGRQRGVIERHRSERLRPALIADHVLHRGADQVQTGTRHVPHPEDDPVTGAFALPGRGKPVRPVALDDHAPVVCDVPSAGGEECRPHRNIRGVDQVRRQQHRVEPAVEREILDPRADGLRTPDVRQHVLGLVDRDDLMAE